MAQRVVVEGFDAERPVAGLAELGQALQKWAPELSSEDANNLLVRPPFDLGRIFTSAEAAAVADELGKLGVRVRIEPLRDDPTWWSERHGDTTIGIDRLTPPAAAAATPAAPAAKGGFWETWTDVVLRPSSFFGSDLVVRGGGHPILFAVIFSVIGAVLATPGNYVLGSAVSTAETSLAGELLAAVVGTPVATLVLVFVFAVFLHVSASIFGGIGNFGVAWRIAAYAAAVNVFQAVPVVGHALILFLYYVYSVAGLQGGYRLTPARAAAAALLPGFLMFLMVLLAVLAIVVALGVTEFNSFISSMQSN